MSESPIKPASSSQIFQAHRSMRTQPFSAPLYPLLARNASSVNRLLPKKASLNRILHALDAAQLVEHQMLHEATRRSPGLKWIVAEDEVPDLKTARCLISRVWEEEGEGQRQG